MKLTCLRKWEEKRAVRPEEKPEWGEELNPWEARQAGAQAAGGQR